MPKTQRKPRTRPKKSTNTMPLPTHSEVQKQVSDYLKWKRWYVIRHQAGPLSHEGLSDLSAVHPKTGFTIYVEIKSGKAKQNKNQELFEAEVKARGGTYIVARGIDELQERGI